MTYISYSALNNLEEVSFIAGTTYYFDFTASTPAGNEITMTGKTLEWRLAPFGEKSYVTLVKTEDDGSITDLDEYTKRVTLLPEDTESLSGKYVQQPIITDSVENIVVKPSQGIVIIVSAIPSDSVGFGS